MEKKPSNPVEELLDTMVGSLKTAWITLPAQGCTQSFATASGDPIVMEARPTGGAKGVEVVIRYEPGNLISGVSVVDRHHIKSRFENENAFMAILARASNMRMVAMPDSQKPISTMAARASY